MTPRKSLIWLLRSYRKRFIRAAVAERLGSYCAGSWYRPQRPREHWAYLLFRQRVVEDRLPPRGGQCPEVSGFCRGAGELPLHPLTPSKYRASKVHVPRTPSRDITCLSGDISSRANPFLGNDSRRCACIRTSFRIAESIPRSST